MKIISAQKARSNYLIKINNILKRINKNWLRKAFRYANKRIKSRNKELCSTTLIWHRDIYNMPRKKSLPMAVSDRLNVGEIMGELEEALIKAGYDVEWSGSDLRLWWNGRGNNI